MSARHPPSPSALAHALESVVERVARTRPLDPIGDAVAKLVDQVMPGGPVRDVASGVPLGHPAHPLLIAVPIGSWTAATFLDLTGGHRVAARRSVALGVVAAVPTAVTGANDWLTTSAAQHRVGLVHAAANDVAVALYTASWWSRRRGWLGGHLAGALGVGVDTTAFQHLPQEWTDVATESDVPSHGGLPVDAALEVRTVSGRVQVRYPGEDRTLCTNPIGT